MLCIYILQCFTFLLSPTLLDGMLPRTGEAQVLIFAWVTCASSDIELPANWLLIRWQSMKPSGWRRLWCICRHDEVSCGEVCEWCESELVVLCNMHLDGLVKVKDLGVQSSGSHYSEETGNVLLISGKFLCSVRKDVQDSSFGSCKGNRPFSMSFNAFWWFAFSPSSWECDVNVSDDFSMFVIRFKGVISGIDFVKVNEVVWEDIGP